MGLDSFESLEIEKILIRWGPLCKQSPEALSAECQQLEVMESIATPCPGSDDENNLQDWEIAELLQNSSQVSRLYIFFEIFVRANLKFNTITIAWHRSVMG